MHAKPQLTKEYTLRRSDFDRYERFLPSAALDLFTEIAIVQSDLDQAGTLEMRAKGGMWVVVRTKIKYCEQPKPHATVSLSTWPYSPTRLTIMRDYKMTDDAGKTMLLGSSEWMIIDAKQRKIAPIGDFYWTEREFAGERAFGTKLKKVHDFDSGDLEGVIIEPTYSDIDGNGHVNNARYADYILNVLQPSEHGVLKTIQIDYRSEIMPDEQLEIYSVKEGRTLHVKGVGSNGQNKFLSSIELEY